MKLRTFSDLRQLSQQSDLPGKTPAAGVRNGKGARVRVFLDSKGRKGKCVTIVSGLQHNPAAMEDLARLLKQHCGAGGSVKEGNIEIQGDQRVRLTMMLSDMNYDPQ